MGNFSPKENKMEDHYGIDNYMKDVTKALKKHIKWPSDEFTEIYNRAWEAVYNAIDDLNIENGGDS